MCLYYLGAVVLIVAIILFIVGLVWLFKYFNTNSSNGDNLGTFLSAALLVLISVFLMGLGFTLVGVGAYQMKSSGLGMRSLARSPLARNM